MELQEPPECPVCLQPYGSISTIPRVLACGHSLCEACIGRLPTAFPDTIRCPVCTELVKLPKPLSSLPKNIDLLRYSSLPQSNDPLSQPKPLNSLQEPEKDSPMFLRALWSREFYLHWKPWVLPENSVSTKPQNSVSKRSDDSCYLLYGCYTECLSNRDVVSNGNLAEEVDACLVKVGIFVHKAESYSKLFKYSYEVKVLRALYEMTDRERNELDVILNAFSRHRGCCEVYGFWYCEDNNFVYLVCKSFGRSVRMLADVVSHNNGCMRRWAMAGLDICEAVHSLHLQGLSFGCLGASCFGMDEFGHACVGLCETLVAVRRVGKMIRDATCNQNLAVVLESEHLAECWFVSPEAMFGLLKIEGVQVDCVCSEYDTGFAADIWSLASLLLLVLIGKSFAQEMQVYLQYFIQNVENRSDLFGWYTGWMKRIICLFESKLNPDFISLKDTLCKCLDFNPQNRPPVIELWTSLREVLVKPDIDVLPNLKQATKQSIPLCFLFGELSLSTWKGNKQSMGGNQSNDVEEVEISKIGKDVIQGIPNGQIKCVNLIEHRDCITCLSTGGGFLFSSSFDKVVNVWSLQNLAHVHAFRGHEQRVTAVTFVDDEQPLCISGDNGGVICIWTARAPLGQEPLKKIYEEKDWRYSGIHALAVSGSKHLYTGSGDKSIKAWSLQDYTLSCTMTGHKSVVSSLVVCNEVLYSGSWDGTVRLWRISDHSLLAVLGENMPSNLTSVTSLAADEHSFVVSHQNGIVKIWYNDSVLKSTQAHNGAVFSTCKKGRWIFTGGWDKSVNVQELCGEGSQTEATVFGSIPCDSVVTALLYWQGKLFVGQTDSVIKVYYSGEQ